MKKLGLILIALMMATPCMAQVPTLNIESDAIQVRAKFVDKMVERAKTDMKVDCRRVADALYSGATLEEAQGVLDLYGNDASELFVLHDAWQRFIIQYVDKNWEYIDPKFQPDINWDDGTVILTEWDVVVEKPVVDEAIYPDVDVNWDDLGEVDTDVNWDAGI